MNITNHSKRVIIKTIVLVLIGVIFWVCIGSLHRMTGNQMYPSFRDGDLGFFYKLDYNGYALNDVVLYKRSDGEIAVGRIVATENQQVSFPDNGGYQVNNYMPVDEIPYETYKSKHGDVQYPLTLHKDEFFILNDFRSDTNDSREIGAVSRSQIKGKLLFLFRRRGF